MVVSPYVYRVRAALVVHAVLFMLLMFWSAVQGNTLSYFFAYRFLYPLLYCQGFWLLYDADRPEFVARFNSVYLWFVGTLLCAALFEGFYLGYHMIARTLVACAGQLGPTVCANANGERARYTVTTIGVALMFLLELVLVGLVLLRNCCWTNSGKAVAKPLSSILKIY